MPEAKREKCRSCGADIFWAKTATGKTCPYDVAETKDDPKAKAYVYAMDLMGQMQRAETGHRSHFQTCVNAAHHSKKAGGGA